MTAPSKNPADRDLVLDHLQSAIPGLDRTAAGAALQQAKADHWSSVARLAAHFRDHRDALAVLGNDAPAPLIRLAHALHTAGHSGAAAPRCADCGRVTDKLVRPGPGGRICGTCKTRHHHAPCARCGQRRRIVARRADGGICGPCYNADPARKEPCGQCGRSAAPVRRLSDGSPRCGRCAPKPQHRCVRCGRSAAAARHGEDGPICYSCYRPPSRSCGACGHVLPIARRATDTDPDVCVNCWHGPQAECAVCGRTRPCRGVATGRPVCASFRPTPRRICHRCRQSRQIVANWPIGPVCRPCYRHIRSRPGTCAHCGTLQPLIARDEHGAAICGLCAGVDVRYDCGGCGTATMLYSDSRCHRCVLALRLTDLLAGPDGTVAPQLQPLIETLSGVDNPGTILIWLRHSTSARLLAQLAATGQPVTHTVLDDLPPSMALHHIRDVLVTTGILPRRDEHLDRVTGFVAHVLADAPVGQAAIVKPYTHWYLIRRARHRSRNRPTTKHGAAGLRASVRAALKLLTWLDTHQVTLATLTQPHLDDWLTANSNQQRYLQPFIAWTNRQRLTRRLAVPTTPRPEPHVFLTERDHTDQLRRCLHDENMPVEYRIAGALVLLFGIPVSRLAQLTRDDIDTDDTGTRLRIGTHWLQLPQRLTDLLTRLIEQPRPTRFTLAKLAPNRWLFPGASPTRPASQSQLLNRLHRHGITATAGRNTARAALASRLPASVLADLTGIHIHTAVAWNRLTGRDWTEYVARRAQDASSGTRQRLDGTSHDRSTRPQ